MRKLLIILFVMFLYCVPVYATNEVKQLSGTAIIIADSTYSPGTNTILGTRTDDMDVVSLAAGAARQSVKFDFGATRAREYQVKITFEMASDPTANGTQEIYLSGSHSATAAIGNSAGCSGADGAYTGYSGTTLAEALVQLGDPIGIANVAVQNDADGVQIMIIGRFSPSERYGCIVWYNNASVALHDDSIEAAISLIPIIDRIEDAP